MDDWDKMRQAFALGPLAGLRLRAEVLLERLDDPTMRPVTVSPEIREELHRIASAPNLEDEHFLRTFDAIYEQDAKDEGS
jgi:hypothetical protein